MKSDLKKLKDIALRFQIDPVQTIGHAAKVNTVIKVLSDINKSYYNYLEVEFLKNKDFRKAFEKNIKILDTIKEDLDLLIVDVKFSSFETAIAPNIVDFQPSIFNDEVKDWKNNTFDSYKEDVVLADYSNPKHLQKIVEKYTEEERARIFQPFFASLGDGKSYKINIKDENGGTTKTLHQPEKTKLSLYVPKISSAQEDTLPEEKNYLVYAKMRKSGKGENISFTKKNIKKVHYIEELDHDIYPFKPGILQYSNLIFILNQKINCDVKYEEENYLIECPDLDILVWGDSREKVEEAFSFSFYSLYNNFYSEQDKNLSKDAILLKKKLKSLIKSVTVIKNETKKK